MGKMQNQMDPSGKTGWTTPKALFQKLDREFHFKLDAAATASNALCQQFITEADDAMCTPWTPGPVFCNPPYGRLTTPEFVRRGWVQASQAYRSPVVMLLPASVDTRWFHSIIARYASEVRFLKGRLRFGNVICADGSVGECPAPFPSMIVVFGKRKIAQVWKGANMRTWDWK